MKGYLESIIPDSFSGQIFALEGIDRVCVLLNGPTGCKFYNSATSDSQRIRMWEFDPLCYPEELFFGQPRVPCTYLDSRDYVYGSREKLTEALGFLRDNVDFDLLCVVNSPGAALIGDDLRGIVRAVLPETPLVIMQTPGYSKSVCGGFDAAATALFEQLSPEPSGKERHGVNFLGLSIFHRDHEGSAAEMRRLMGLCGVEVNCFLCESGGLDEIKAVPDAALNVVLYPEYGLATAKYLKERYGTPYYVCEGPPIGFSATEKFVKDVCALLGAEPSAALEDCAKARARVYVFISRLNSLTGLPKGVRFSVEGTYSECCAYVSFLTGYFGMAAECVTVLGAEYDCCRKKLEDLLASLGLSDALTRGMEEAESELVLASGATIAHLKLGKRRFVGIETSLPSMGYVDVIPKTHLGVAGALLLTEQVINGMIY